MIQQRAALIEETERNLNQVFAETEHEIEELSKKIKKYE